MQILAAEQIRAWDQYTILHEPISSIDLMERAAETCYRWLLDHGYGNRSFTIFCGKGSNGGDGLALARMLASRPCSVTVHIPEFGHMGTDDFQANLARLHATTVSVRFITQEAALQPVPPGDIVIDALFGSGLNRPLEGLNAAVIRHMNDSGNEVIAIDIPSGLFVDRSSKGNATVHARHTLSFQCYKIAFMVAENAQAMGNLHMLDIGLHPGFLKEVQTPWQLSDEALIRSFFRPRPVFSHKGNFGHALLIAGSYGKMGAAVLSARACLRSGVGLLTAHIPSRGYDIFQSTVPEAMTDTDAGSDQVIGVPENLSKYNVLGIGPGLGTSPQIMTMLNGLLDVYRHPVVVDADGLNCLAADKNMLAKLPAHSVITPHPKEFTRLFGEAANDFDRIALAVEQAREHQLVIVLKGHHTLIATPEGKHYFNNTGNPGMATGGTGDVLTGVVTGLMAQGYTPADAAVLGVYIHGQAGDLAAAYGSQEALIASDLVDHLGETFTRLYQAPA